jgi:hypothetical protein
MSEGPIESEEGMLPSVNEDPDIIALRIAIFEYACVKLPEPNTVTSITDINGVKHKIFGNDIIIEQIEDEPKANIKNKSTMAIIGAGFTLGALMIAIGVAKTYNRRPKE